MILYNIYSSARCCLHAPFFIFIFTFYFFTLVSHVTFTLQQAQSLIVQGKNEFADKGLDSPNETRL